VTTTLLANTLVTMKRPQFRKILSEQKQKLTLIKQFSSQILWRSPFLRIKQDLLLSYCKVSV